MQCCQIENPRNFSNKKIKKHFQNTIKYHFQRSKIQQFLTNTLCLRNYVGTGNSANKTRALQILPGKNHTPLAIGLFKLNLYK